jgi:hypothetical protein
MTALPTVVESVLQTIGHTPVVRLQRLVPSGSADVFVKLEYFNPTGSYKDRMALAMIEGAERRGALRPGMRVVEYTGGSTGSSLAMVCAIKGYEFHPLSSDAFAVEKLDTMRAFGADLEVVRSEGGKVTPALFDRFKARIAELTRDPNTFWTDQFHNADALDGYINIGRELADQVGRVDAFVGAVGTAGMLVGVSKALKESGPRHASSRSSRRRPRFSRRAKVDHMESRAPPPASGRHISAKVRSMRRVPSTNTKAGRWRAARRRRKASSRGHPRASTWWARCSWRASSVPARLSPQLPSIPGSSISPAICTSSSRSVVVSRGERVASPRSVPLGEHKANMIR